MYFSNIQILMLVFAFIIAVLGAVKMYQIKKEYLMKQKELEVESEKIELERLKITATPEEISK